MVCSDLFKYMGMKYPVMLRHLGLKRVLLDDASFDWWLALEWLAPVTNSQTEQVGSSLVPLMCLVDEVPGVKRNQQLTKMQLQRHGDGDKDSRALTKNQNGGSVGNLNQQRRSPSLSYCSVEPNIYKVEGSIRDYYQGKVKKANDAKVTDKSQMRLMHHACFDPESDHGGMFGFGKALWQLRRMIYG